jgi:hypothetical protein
MVAPKCFGIILLSSGSVPSAFWEILNWGSVDRILRMGVLCLVMWCAVHTTSLVFVGFSRIFLLGILIFKGLTARRLYKSFSVKGLIILSFDAEVRAAESVNKQASIKINPLLSSAWKQGAIVDTLYSRQQKLSYSLYSISWTTEVCHWCVMHQPLLSNCAIVPPAGLTVTDVVIWR